MEKKASTFGSILPMMFNPAAFLQNYFERMSLIFSILISGLGFGLFFLQTGLDLYKTGQKPLNFAYKIGGIGFLYGVLIIPFFGILLWIFLKIARSKSTFKQTLCATCLSYSSLLIYSIFGMIFSILLNWRTSIAFGTTGAVWSIGTLIGTIRQLSNGKTGLAVFLSIVFGTIVLFSWYYVGNI
ncbi:MAG TPA: YIP1 family protein [Pseudothermotoga sp.]